MAYKQGQKRKSKGVEGFSMLVVVKLVRGVHGVCM